MAVSARSSRNVAATMPEHVLKACAAGDDVARAVVGCRPTAEQAPHWRVTQQPLELLRRSGPRPDQGPDRATVHDIVVSERPT